MRRLLTAIVCLALLFSQQLQADYLINPGRFAAVGSRPVLAGTNTSGFSTTNASSRTVSVTPPVGTTLVVAYMAYSHDNDAANTPITPTLNGVNMTLARPWESFSENGSDTIAYFVNPTTNVAQNLIFSVSGVTWDSSFLYVWFFSNVNTSDPIGITGGVNSTSAQSVTATLTPEYSVPYFVAGAHARADGTGNCWTGTNLTVLVQGNEEPSGANITMAAFSNATLTQAGSTGFTARCSWPSEFRTSDVVEVKGP